MRPISGFADRPKSAVHRGSCSPRGEFGSAEAQRCPDAFTIELVPLFMPAPALVSTAAVRRAVTEDAGISEVMAAWEHLTIALVGIGTLDPSPLLQGSGNAIAAGEREQLRELSAVGDVCLRFFDHAGQLVPSPLNDRVLGITPPTLMRVSRRIGVAGGPAKYPAIRAALLGGWVNILVTDLTTAQRLISDAEPGQAEPGQPAS
jgi:DNA-binding transcriptional regulator LsrR (DeoR family)